MSNLGSYGISNVQNTQNQSEQQSSLATPENPHMQSYIQMNQLSQSANPHDHELGMKLLLAMMSKGLDVSNFFTFVVNQVASTDPITRQLAYIYLNHYAEENPDTAILSLNTFQKSLTDSDPIVRASAIKVMSSIRSKEILPAIRSSVNQVINDTSPYVKKAAAFAMIKASEMEPSEIPNYLQLIGYLLGDSSPIAFSGAIAAYWSLSPDNIDLLHPHFRSICQNITKLDEYAQILTLRALTVYSRRCFKNPLLDNDVEVDDVSFWDENGTKESISDDHLLLITATKQLLSSLNSGVVLAASSLLFYTAPSIHISSVARPLVRLIYEDPSTTAQVALKSILAIATVYSHIFVPHINHFFVRSTDQSAIKQLKLKVLALLATPTNSSMILNELSKYARSVDQEFAASAIRTMGNTSINNPEIIPQCLGSLLRIMGRAEGQVLSEVVTVISYIIRQKRGTEDEAQALKKLCSKFLVIKDTTARTAVLSIVSDMNETHPDFAYQLLKHIAINYLNEPDRVRLQSLTLAAKLIASGSDTKVPIYVIKIGQRDSEYDIRDRANFLIALINNQTEEIKDNLKNILCPNQIEPNWVNNKSDANYFTIGSISHFFNHTFAGYEPLPDWAPEDQLPDESVRSQVRMLPDGKRMVAISGDDDDYVDINQWFANRSMNDLNNDNSKGENEYYSSYDDDSGYSYSYSYDDDKIETGGFFD